MHSFHTFGCLAFHFFQVFSYDIERRTKKNKYYSYQVYLTYNWMVDHSKRKENFTVKHDPKFYFWKILTVPMDADIRFNPIYLNINWNNNNNNCPAWLAERWSTGQIGTHLWLVVVWCKWQARTVNDHWNKFVFVYYYYWFFRAFNHMSLSSSSAVVCLNRKWPIHWLPVFIRWETKNFYYYY